MWALTVLKCKEPQIYALIAQLRVRWTEALNVL